MFVTAATFLVLGCKGAISVVNITSLSERFASPTVWRDGLLQGRKRKFNAYLQYPLRGREKRNQGLENLNNVEKFSPKNG